MSISDSWKYLLSLGVQHHCWDDPIFVEGLHVCSPLQKMPCIDLDDEALLHSNFGVIKCSAPRCGKTFDTVADHAAHHRSCHNYTCSLCKQSFHSHHLLDLHLLEKHDSLFQLMAERQPMYQCLLETCPEKFSNPAERKKHCMAKHKFPADFRFDLTWRKIGKKKKTKGNQNDAEMECEDDMEDMMDDNSNQSFPDPIIMDDTNPTENSNKILRKTKQKIPSQVSFGVGVPRGFHRGRRSKSGSSHWHQRARPHGVTKTNIEEVNMKELESSLMQSGGKI